MIFTTRVNGIPCQCNVVHFEPAVPMRIYGSGMGDADPPEGPEFDFELLDRRDRRALWLEKYLTEDDHQRLYDEFMCAVKAEDYNIY